MPDIRPTQLQQLKKLMNRARVRGLAEVWSLALSRFKEAISSSEELVIFVRETSSEAGDGPGLKLREATATDAEDYARWIGTDSPSTFKDRLSERTRCFVVEAEGRLVHATWMTTASAWTREVQGYFRAPPSEAYVYESFTREDVRGRGVYPFALRGISAWLSSHEVRRVWVAVEAHNAASLRSVAKAGFSEADRIRYRRRFGRIEVDGPRCGAEPPTTLCLARST